MGRGQERGGGWCRSGGCASAERGALAAQRADPLPSLTVHTYFPVEGWGIGKLEGGRGGMVSSLSRHFCSQSLPFVTGPACPRVSQRCGSKRCTIFLRSTSGPPLPISHVEKHVELPATETVQTPPRKRPNPLFAQQPSSLFLRSRLLVFHAHTLTRIQHGRPLRESLLEPKRAGDIRGLGDFFGF